MDKDIKGKTPLLYDAMTGEKYAADITANADTVKLSLNLQPWESIFVVFEDNNGSDAAGLPKRISIDACERALQDGKAAEYIINAPDKITKATSLGYPEFEECDVCRKVVSEGRFVNMAKPEYLPKFSGTLRYEMHFNIEEGALSDPENKTVAIDLGRVYEVADVTLNGNHLGTKICPPYVFVDSAAGAGLKEGDNTLVVEVVNTLVKEHGVSWFDLYFVQEPTGMLSPVKVIVC